MKRSLSGCTSLVLVLLVLFCRFPTDSVQAQKVVNQCGWHWKWVWRWVPTTRYNGASGRYESTTEYQYVYDYVYDCEFTVAAPEAAAPRSRSASNALAPAGEVQKVWVDHSVYDKQVKGMRIHFKFSARNLKDRQCQANAYFYFSSGKPLKDFNGRYKTTDGDVAARGNFTPKYVSSVFEDFLIFMPYDELHMSAGKTDLKLVVKLYCEGLGFLAESQDYSFSYSRPK